MEAEAIKIIAQLGGTGVGVFALYMFKKIITEHREERKEDNALWRDTIKEMNNETKTVIKDLGDIINRNRDRL